MCSAASTASPSSLGLVKVRLLATHSPAPPFQTQLPHSWTAAKKTPNTMLLEKLLANQSLRPSADKSVAAPTPQLPYGWCHRECSTRTRRGQQGKSLHSAATDTTASDCSSYRIYKPMPQPATAPPIGSKPSSSLEVETAGNGDDPGLSGNDAVTDKRMNPQYKVCSLTGIRCGMGAGSGAGRP